MENAIMQKETLGQKYMHSSLMLRTKSNGIFSEWMKCGAQIWG